MLAAGAPPEPGVRGARASPTALLLLLSWRRLAVLNSSWRESSSCCACASPAVLTAASADSRALTRLLREGMRSACSRGAHPPRFADEQREQLLKRVVPSNWPSHTALVTARG